jgi:hypothetical protein
MTSTSKPKLSRLPFVLLGLMTLFSFGGPLAFGYVLGGGSSNRWPPDRTVEWATLIGISAVVLILMAVCLSLAFVNHKELSEAEKPSKPDATRPES